MDAAEVPEQIAQPPVGARGNGRVEGGARRGDGDYFAGVNYALRYPQTATSLVAPDGTCLGHAAYGEEALLVADLDPEAATGVYAGRYAPDRYGE